jgi:hypothetical protein
MKKDLTNFGYTNFFHTSYTSENGVILIAKEKKTGVRYAIKGIKITENKIVN